MTIFSYHIELYFILFEGLPLDLHINIIQPHMCLHKKENIGKTLLNVTSASSESFSTCLLVI